MSSITFSKIDFLVERLIDDIIVHLECIEHVTHMSQLADVIMYLSIHVHHVYDILICW